MFLYFLRNSKLFIESAGVPDPLRVGAYPDPNPNHNFYSEAFVIKLFSFFCLQVTVGTITPVFED